MLGIDGAGKTTMLYKLHYGDVISKAIAIGFNIETLKHKNIMFTAWDTIPYSHMRIFYKPYY
jgi:GTPase SAR1 family protein